MKKNIVEAKPRLPEHRGRRCIAEKISTSFLQLLQKYPYLLESQVDALCGNTEINYIRSLLVAADPGSYRSYFYEQFGVVPNTVLEPVRMAHNVRFNIAREHKSKVKRAKRVLLKRAFGSLTGLVLSKDYSGLIIDFHALPEDENFKLKTPTANRVWAQKPMSGTEAAYGLWFLPKERERVGITMETQLGYLSKEFPQERLYEHLYDNPFLDLNIEHLHFLLEEADIDFNSRYFVSSSY